MCNDSNLLFTIYNFKNLNDKRIIFLFITNDQSIPRSLTLSYSFLFSNFADENADRICKSAFTESSSRQYRIVLTDFAATEHGK